MQKEVKFPSMIFKNPKYKKWPLFKHLIKPLSFQSKYNMFKNFNSILSDTARFIAMIDSPRSLSKCLTMAPLEENLVEMAVEAVRSKRLLFEPGNTSSILDAASVPFLGCALMAVESENPYLDFRVSMEEMVEAYGLKDWECLEELLAWFLRLNRKKNHGLIIDAFVDICFSISCSASASSSRTNDWWEIDKKVNERLGS